jgi:pyridoxamine 5'-phosphate oxidase-like protein
MAKRNDELTDDLAAFIAQQHLFFVGTAPSDLNGHLNVSPKGLDTFRVLDHKTVAYLDLIGSGIETVAHVRENGRLILMFCALEGRPQILRLHGRGRVVEPGEAEWEQLRPVFPAYPNGRAIVVMELDRVATSCGFGVPMYEYRGERSQLGDWAKKKGSEGLEQYKAQNNRTSLDGLAGLRTARAEQSKAAGGLAGWRGSPAGNERKRTESLVALGFPVARHRFAVALELGFALD